MRSVHRVTFYIAHNPKNAENKENTSLVNVVACVAETHSYLVAMVTWWLLNVPVETGMLYCPANQEITFTNQ